ncbi:MAG: hypothetical protein R2838_20510 [Caldilineaceae bacterium]
MARHVSTGGGEATPVYYLLLHYWQALGAWVGLGQNDALSACAGQPARRADRAGIDAVGPAPERAGSACWPVCWWR